MWFENIDGFGIGDCEPLNKNKNLKYYNNLISRVDIDIFAGVESRLQWDMVPRSHCLHKLLDLREGARSCHSHNIHEKFSMHQQGGTFLATNTVLGESVKEHGVDETGLGRWSWMKFCGRGATTRVVVAYQPCRTRKRAKNATAAQQRRYWRARNNYQCPRKLFRHQLLEQLRKWRTAGEKLVLLIDANEDMESGPLQKLLRDTDLDMKDAVKQRSGLSGPATWARGSKQIDGVWVTPDLEVNSACFLPFYFGLGDH